VPGDDVPGVGGALAARSHAALDDALDVFTAALAGSAFVGPALFTCASELGSREGAVFDEEGCALCSLPLTAAVRIACS
jgi:hypothetical protein